jgi:hypothetical protein
MQKQREGSSEEATLWSDVDGDADGYGKKEKKMSVASSDGVATALKKLDKPSWPCPKALCKEKPYIKS